MIFLLLFFFLLFFACFALLLLRASDIHLSFFLFFFFCISALLKIFVHSTTGGTVIFIKRNREKERKDIKKRKNSKELCIFTILANLIRDPRCQLILSVLAIIVTRRPHTHIRQRMYDRCIRVVVIFIKLFLIFSIFYLFCFVFTAKRKTTTKLFVRHGWIIENVWHFGSMAIQE